MKIAFDIQALQTIGSRDRGVGRYTYSLLKKILELDLENEYVLIANANLKIPKINGLSPHRLISLSYPNGDRRVSELLQKVFLLAGTFDVFHISGNPLEVFDLIISKYHKSFPSRVVWTLFDIIPYLFPNTYLQDPDVKNIYCSRLNTLVEADHIFAISESTRQDVIKHLGVYPEKITNVGAGVDSIFLKPLNFDQRMEWSSFLQQEFKISKKFVLYLGGGDIRKGISEVIKAFTNLSKLLSEEYQLVIAGKLLPVEKRHYSEIGLKHGIRKSLVFTNFVSDDVLVALYSLCSLFVYPSKYEGFGLPLLEAMTCGSPVITTNVSSLPEVVGDAGICVEPGSVEQLSKEMNRVLMDKELRFWMSRRSIEQAKKFTWENVATKVLNVYRELGPKQSLSFNSNRSCNSSEVKPKIAIFSPVNPIKSGISDYTEELLPHLAEYFQIDLYIDSNYQISSDFILKQCHWYNYHSFEQRAKDESYFAVLYQLGNSSYHAYMIDSILKYGGIITLHDYALGGLINWLSTQLPIESPNRLDLFEELKYNYHKARAEDIFMKIKQGKIFPHELLNAGVSLNKKMFDRSVGMVVHSRWAREMAKKDFPDYPDHCLKYIPAGVPILPEPTEKEIKEIRQKLGIPEDTLVFAAFGIISIPKRVTSAIKAFATLAKKNSRVLLLFIGECQPGYIEPIQLIHKLNLGEKVRFADHVNFNTLYEYMKACNVVLNLRYPTQGEVSASLLRAMSLGKPAIVSNGGSFTDFPDNAVMKVIYGPNDEEDITEKIALLAHNAELRHRVGERGRSYILERHSLTMASKQYVEFIFQLVQRRSAHLKLVADLAAKELVNIGISDHDDGVIDLVAKTILL